MKNLRFCLFQAILLAAALFCAIPSQAALTSPEERLAGMVDSARIMNTIERMCGDDFAGRRAGSPEHYLVADYLAREMESIGLSADPVLGGMKQPLTMRYSLVESPDQIKARISYTAGGKKQNRTFAYRDYNGRGGLSVSSKVVFVGYGISDPSSGYNDYAGLDITGKTVLWLPGRPAGVKLGISPSGAQKMLTAYQHGAVACLILRRAGIKDAWGTNVGFAGAIADFPYIGVDERIADELMSASGLRPSRIKNGAKVKSGVAGVSIHLAVTPVCDPVRKTYNIIGHIPGSDSALKDEVVLVGAHYDHLGRLKSGGILRGADDNASGSAVVLEAARSIMQSGLPPRRTIVFALWTGEEGGLIGSNYFAGNPPFPLKNIVSNIELDMVGTGTPGVFGSTGAAAYPRHFTHIAQSASDLGLILKRDSLNGASDHLAFTRKNVPSSLIYAEGKHPYYHTVKDTPETLKPEVLESAAKLVILSAWRAANL